LYSIWSGSNGKPQGTDSRAQRQSQQR